MNDQADDHGLMLRSQLDSRIRDAQYEREKHEEQWAINNQLYHGAHRTAFAAGSKRSSYFTANQIQSAVITQVAVMTESPIRPVFVPRETNEPPEIFLKPESAYKIAAVEGHGLSEAQLMGAEIIPEALFDFLASQTETQEQPNPRAGETVETGSGENMKTEMQPETIEVQVPIFTDEDFIFVDDGLCAEALTQEHNSEWEMCTADKLFRKAITQASVIGHQDVLVQWNEQESRVEFVNLYAYNTWIDRWSDGTENAEYFIMREVKPVSEAKREFPEHAAYIEANKTSAANSGWWGGYGGGKYDTALERDVVELFTTWERHYPFPMSPEEASEKALVMGAVEQPLIDEQTGEIADLGGQPIEGEFNLIAGRDEMGMPVPGEPTRPGEANWPIRYGIKQTTQLGSMVLYEGEAEFVDIPVGRIINIPIVESPYGQGEPQRLYDLQDLKNRLWGIYYDYCLYYRSPEQVMPLSVLNELKKEAATLHSNAGRKLGVPDDLYLMFQRDLVQTVPIPQMTDTFFNLMRFIKEEMNDIAGTVDVLRGDAKSEWSGELFAQATNAARGPIGYKARGVSEALRHLAKVAAGLIVDFLPLDEWIKRNKKYPPQVLEVMRQRLKRIGYDVSVEVGGASSRDSEAQKLINLTMNNPQLTSSPTFMSQFLELVGVKEGEKIVREIQAAMVPPEPQA